MQPITNLSIGCFESDRYAIGGVPLFGHATQLRVFVDPDLLQYDEVWAAAGTRNDNFAIAPNELVRVSGGAAIDLERGWISVVFSYASREVQSLRGDTRRS